MCVGVSLSGEAGVYKIMSAHTVFTFVSAFRFDTPVNRDWAMGNRDQGGMVVILSRFASG